MRKYGKWVLTLSLLATTPGLTFAADSKSKDASPTRTTRVDNQRVAEDIATALRGKVKGEIGIEYKDGTAILTGSVTDPKSKKTAEGLVRQVTNVSKVDNRLSVVEKKKTFSDRLRSTEAGDDVVQAGHAGENRSRGRVQQINAEVAQLGLDDQSSAVPPAAAVSNGAGGAANQEVAEQIGAVLSAAQLDGYDIQIRFQNGVATLDGSVGNQAERAAAHRAVAAVPGVRSVANRLRCSEEPAPQSYRPAQGQYAYAGPGAGPMAGPGPMQGQGPMQGPGPMQGRGDVRGAGYMQQAGGPQGYPGGGAMPMGPGGAPPYPPAYGYAGGGASQAVYNSPACQTTPGQRTLSTPTRRP